MEFKEFQLYFSTSRINRYLVATNNSPIRAVNLYKANLKISQSFHPLLGVFEVVLRNRINDILAVHFSDPNWIINQKKGFMSDKSLTYVHKKSGHTKTNDFLKSEISKAEKRLKRATTPITSGKIIAEQTLGFWTDLFEVHHYRLLKGKPIKVFTSLPSGYGRKEITDELAKIRFFRNRINHNEPICFTNEMVDFTQAIEVHNSINNLLSWIDPSLQKFIKEIDNVNETIKSADNL